MLLWGAAAAIPIVLHLLNRRRQQTVAWAAMRLLLQVIEKQSKRIRIEQLILLLLRTLILVTLALALARPFFSVPSDAGTIAAQRAPRLWVLAIDNSYSMGYREEATARFAAAMNRAAEILQSATRGDAFAIVTLSEPSEPVVFRPTFDVTAASGALQKVQLHDGGADLPSAVALVNDIIAEAARGDDLPTDVHVIFLSDFGQDTWQDALAAGRAQRSLKQLADEHTVVYEPVALAEASNVAVMSMSVSSTRALVDSPLAVDVTVTNFGSVALTQVPLQLTANGQAVDSQFLDLPAGATRAVQLTVRPPSTGLLTITASLPEDRLLADNERMAVVEVREDIRVLCVENPYSDERILKSALQPPVGAQGAMRVTSISQLELNLTDVKEFDVVVLNDITSLSTGEFERLMQFVNSGRSLVCLIGQNADATAWNELLLNSGSAIGFQLLEASAIDDWRIDPMEYSSPIVAPFAAYPDAGLLTTPIFRYWTIQLDEDATKRPEVELKLHDGSPLIVHKRLGKGRVAAMLSAPQTGSMTGENEPWNAMAAWPSFVPLMQQLVQATLADSAANLNLIVGQPIVGSLRAEGSSSVVKILRPDGNEAEVQTSETDENGLRNWSYAATNQHGVYQAMIAGASPRPFAVNINPNQSDLRTLAVNQLPKSTEKTPSQVTANSDSNPALESNALVRWLLGSLAAMLVAESCLAWYLGRKLA